MFVSLCENCTLSFESKSSSQRFCSKTCAARTNNIKHPKRAARGFTCLGCEELKSGRPTQKYCSPACMGIKKRRDTVTRFLAGESVAVTSRAIKDYLLSKQEGHCALCPLTTVWNEKPLVFVLDHIDGNAENNHESNLRLVCPNCDSQLPTFKSRNRGNGRHARRIRYADGKSF